MIDPVSALPAAGLLFILGVRHGIDPDHIAVIDNLTFLAADERPRQAPWTGALFAIGHSLSVTVVAVLVAALAHMLAMPQWLPGLIDWLVIGLLFMVGCANLLALLRGGRYRPVGWRSRFLPRALHSTCHPLAIILVGMVFGAVFDTATQAAAWGAAATSGGGILTTLRITAFFAIGMMTTDTIDSQIVARLLRSEKRPELVRLYRRGIGWLIVALSFGMAAYALAETLGIEVGLQGNLFALLGGGMMAAVIALLLTLRLLAGRGRESGRG